MGGRGGRGGGKKNAVTFTKPPEPSFLKKMKEQLGYKEGPTIDTKREALPEYGSGDDEEEGNKDEERPTVVVLKPGDLTAEEANRLMDKEPSTAEGGRVLFKKPTKRISSEEDPGKNDSPAGKVSKVRSGIKSVKNKSLLSFNDAEDDDDEEDS